MKISCFSILTCEDKMWPERGKNTGELKVDEDSMLVSFNMRR
jgi:hypothetical protein